MPTKNPRLSVVLSPSLAATLSAISMETGDSAASIVRTMLDQAEPAFVRMLELVRAAKAAQGQINDGVSGAMDRVINDLQDALAVADSRSSRVVADLVSQAEVVKGRRRAAVRPGGARLSGRAVPLSTPVPVTRGSGTPRKGESREEGEGVQSPKTAGKGVGRGRI